MKAVILFAFLISVCKAGITNDPFEAFYRGEVITNYGIFINLYAVRTSTSSTPTVMRIKLVTKHYIVHKALHKALHKIQNCFFANPKPIEQINSTDVFEALNSRFQQ